MKRLFLVVFGLYGIVVACLDGIKPFLDFSFLVTWVMENWLIWTREFWGAVFKLIGFSLPTWIADGLSGLVYAISTVSGLRSVHSFGFERFLTANNLHDKTVESLFWLPKPIKLVLSYMLGLVLFLPYILVAILLYKSSASLGLSYSLAALFFAYMPDLFRSQGFFNRLKKWLLGEMPGGLESEDILALSFLTVPFYALVALLILLLLNEVAVQGDNIANFVEWMRCDAGIECTQ